MLVILLALFGMVCWGIAPIFAKLGLAHVNPMAALVLRTMIAAGLVSSWMIFGGTFAQVKSIPFNSWILIAIEAVLATLIGDLAYYAAIKKGEVSLVTVIMASSPLVTMLCAILFLGEQITVWRVVGASLIIIGIILVI